MKIVELSRSVAFGKEVYALLLGIAKLVSQAGSICLDLNKTQYLNLIH